MDISHTSHNRCELITVSGRIDSATSDQLESQIKELQDAGKFNVAADLSGVDFISSRGLWVLIEAQKKSNHGDQGKIVLAGLSEKIKSSFELVGMDKFFTYYEDALAAVGSF
jgi:anti-sigma B factor antagonist